MNKLPNFILKLTYKHRGVNMKILKYPFLAILLITFNISAQEEIKFGVSVGLEKIDYNLTQTAIDGGFGSAQNNGGDDLNASATREGSMSYMVPANACIRISLCRLDKR